MSSILALPRRDAFMVRRDASTTLGNGHVRYDALFSRWGMQDYPTGVEFRPREEVFAPASLESGANNPGVLLHPAKNFRTNFGDGKHPPRGTTGDTIVQHTDGIHTAGKLIVWDSEWNDQIMSGETAELSVGFSVDPSSETGTAPADAPGVDLYGADYVAVHRGIVWDHVAGVPAGNAGTARVLLDAATSRIHPATRRAMALIAAERADARTYYFDLAQWGTRRRAPAQETTHMDEIIAKIKACKTPQQLGKLLDSREVADAMVEIKGEQTDPAMMAAIQAALAAMTEPAPTEPPPSEGSVPEGAEPIEQQNEAEAEPDDKMDAAELAVDRMDAASRRIVAEVMGAAREALGADYMDAAYGKPIAEVKRDVVAKLDPARVAKIDAAPKSRRAAMLEVHFDECREQLDARNSWGARIVHEIIATRQQKQVADSSTVRGPIAAREEAIKPAPATAHT